MVDHGAQQTPRLTVVAVLTTLGLLSAGFGFGAEATKPELAEVLGVEQHGRCTYPSSTIPKGLGLAAILALLVSRFYCSGYCSRTRSSYFVAQLCCFLCWMAWLGAICFYIAGLIMMSSQGELERAVYTRRQGGRFEYSYSYNVCDIVKPGIFGAGASFALASIIFDIIYLAVIFDHVDKPLPISQLNLARSLK